MAGFLFQDGNCKHYRYRIRLALLQCHEMKNPGMSRVGYQKAWKYEINRKLFVSHNSVTALTSKRIQQRKPQSNCLTGIISIELKH